MDMSEFVENKEIDVKESDKFESLNEACVEEEEKDPISDNKETKQLQKDIFKTREGMEYDKVRSKNVKWKKEEEDWLATVRDKEKYKVKRGMKLRRSKNFTNENLETETIYQCRYKGGQ